MFNLSSGLNITTTIDTGTIDLSPLSLFANSTLRSQAQGSLQHQSMGKQGGQGWEEISSYHSCIRVLPLVCQEPWPPVLRGGGPEGVDLETLLPNLTAQQASLLGSIPTLWPAEGNCKVSITLPYPLGTLSPHSWKNLASDLMLCPRPENHGFRTLQLACYFNKLLMPSLL